MFQRGLRLIGVEVNVDELEIACLPEKPYNEDATCNRFIHLQTLKLRCNPIVHHDGHASSDFGIQERT
eukprot:290302-Pyramimonas_sp.AAC.1